MFPREQVYDPVLQNEYYANPCVEAAEVAAHERDAEARSVHVLRAPSILPPGLLLRIVLIFVLTQLFRRYDLRYDAAEQAVLEALPSLRRTILTNLVFYLLRLLSYSVSCTVPLLGFRGGRAGLLIARWQPDDWNRLVAIYEGASVLHDSCGYLDSGETLPSLMAHPDGMFAVPTAVVRGCTSRSICVFGLKYTLHRRGHTERGSIRQFVRPAVDMSPATLLRWRDASSCWSLLQSRDDIDKVVIRAQD